MSTESFNLANNPLAQPPVQPFNAPPLGLFKPEHVEPAVAWALKEARKNIDAIAGNPAPPTFENTIHALAFAGEKLDAVRAPFSEMYTALKTKDVQETMKKIQPDLVQYGLDVQLNEALFRRVKTVYDTVDRTALSVEETTLLDNTYSYFVNGGASLKGDRRDEFKSLSQKLAELRTEYGNNLANSRAALKVVIKAADKERLAGIPADVVDFYQNNAKKIAASGSDPAVSADDYVIPMAPPPLAVMEYADDRSLREETKRTIEKIGSQAPFDNTRIVHDILETRHKIANLLGFKNHAERTIRPDTRMAETPATVMDFLDRNAKAYLPVARKFYEEMAGFAQKRDGVEALKSWDRLYYARLMQQEQIGFNAGEARPYFAMENVLKGMFAHGEKLYGIKVQEAEGKYTKQHEDVRTYEVLDATTGDVKALYFLDPYGRDFKNAGAWMSGIRNAGLHDGKQEIPIVTNYCNFTKPAPGKPALLTLSEATALWHEFGHACHGMMGRGTYPELSGTNVHWDYVELPSQINERWALKPDVLATYAVHHETGAPIPAELVEKLQETEKFETRWQGIRQTQLALIDMALHMADPAAVTDLGAFQDDVWKDITVLETDEPPLALSFNHIMAGGYAAGYYSYKWADALVADVFEQFEEQGLYKPSLCEAFRKTMIEPGGTKPPAVMHKDFMESAGQGRRDLDPAALYRAEGLLPPKKAGNIPGPKAP